MERVPNCPLAVTVIETQCHVGRNGFLLWVFKVQRKSIGWKKHYQINLIFYKKDENQ